MIRIMKLGIYKHYKGDLYEVIGIARHTETMEEMIIYKALYGDYKMWVRPKQLFDALVIHNGSKVRRFEYIALTAQAKNNA